LFQSPEGRAAGQDHPLLQLVLRLHIIPEVNINGLGLEGAKEMDKQTHAFVLASPDYAAYKKALFK
jgi:hypothetical protein